MIEIMFQGEGGHGSVVAAKLLAQAAAENGFQAQSFASYGALRRGGRVEGYVRISESSITLRSKMYRSDILVIMDESLIDEKTTPETLKEEGKILINTPRSGSEFPFLKPFEVFTVDAYKIAVERGLVIPGGMSVINTTMLGALSGMLEVISLDRMVEVIKGNTPKPEKNAACAEDGFKTVNSGDGQDGAPAAGSGGDSSRGLTNRRLPVYHLEKMKHCHRCQICYMVCPTLAVHFEGDPLRFLVNSEACNGCGICIEECPRDAISWEGKEND